MTGIVSRREQYLIAPRPAEFLPMGVEPFDVGVLEQTLRDDADIETVRTIAPRGVVAAMSTDAAGAQPVMVARMPNGRAESLRQMPGLIVERDMPLQYGEPVVTPEIPPIRDPGTLVPFGEEVTITVVVTGADGAPLAGAQVYLFGRLWPFQGSTDAAGRVALTMFGERADTVVALYVKPKADHWSIHVQRPRLEEGQDNVVSLPTLSQGLPGFPQQEVAGWGSRALRIDKLPPAMRGAGVRVAVVDSGASGAHADLGRVVSGWDMTTTPDDPETWKDDTIGHGSHCLGVIGGTTNGRGIVGVAPDADAYVYKIFPGGRSSDLIDALQRCIDDQIDVVNLSLGSSERSELLEQKITLAKKMGVACVAAAGNSSGPVQHPGSFGDVLTVSAVGKKGEFPEVSYHATQIAKDTKIDPEGYFSAKFTCFGPEIDVCGPGVGIVSAVPPDNYAAWDGTSMAAPHIAGLATLVLAHHPDFQGRFKVRSAERVDRLFEIIKQSSRPLDFGDRNRVGAGLPDAPRALGLEQAPADQGAPAATGAPGGLGQLGDLVRDAGLTQPGQPVQPLHPTQPAAQPVAPQSVGQLLRPQSAGPEPGQPEQQEKPPPSGDRGGQPAAGGVAWLRGLMQQAELLPRDVTAQPMSADAEPQSTGIDAILGAMREAMEMAGLLDSRSERDS